MLPQPIINLSEKLRLLPGIGLKSSQKMSIDILQLSNEDFGQLMLSLQQTRSITRFCDNCGFFASDKLCQICSNPNRNQFQICIVEKPTDVLSLEKSENYKGFYHILNRLISPLDNVFAENTTVNQLLEQRMTKLIQSGNTIELIMFLKPGFSAEATTAYIRENIIHKKWNNKVIITQMAQGLPLYYNPDTLDTGTIARALQDRREI